MPPSYYEYTTPSKTYMYAPLSVVIKFAIDCTLVLLNTLRLATSNDFIQVGYYVCLYIAQLAFYAVSETVGPVIRLSKMWLQ